MRGARIAVLTVLLAVTLAVTLLGAGAGRARAEGPSKNGPQTPILVELRTGRFFGAGPGDLTVDAWLAARLLPHLRVGLGYEFFDTLADDQVDQFQHPIARFTYGAVRAAGWYHVEDHLGFFVDAGGSVGVVTSSVAIFTDNRLADGSLTEVGADLVVGYARGSGFAGLVLAPRYSKGKFGTTHVDRTYLSAQLVFGVAF